MIPETSANRTVEIYRATSFPDRWTLEDTLLEGVSASDATLVERDGRLWLFAALALLAALGIAIFAALSALEWVFLRRWHESARKPRI